MSPVEGAHAKYVKGRLPEKIVVGFLKNDPQKPFGFLSLIITRVTAGPPATYRLPKAPRTYDLSTTLPKGPGKVYMYTGVR